MNILDRFKDIVSDNPFIIEIGAHNGYHTKKLLSLLKDKNYLYHLFEPSPLILDELLTTLRYIDLSRVKIFTEAIGSKTGDADFYLSIGSHNGEVYNGSSSIKEPHMIYTTWQGMEFKKDVCSVITLDDHIKRTGINQPIDFIWADIQGAQEDLIKDQQTFKRVRYLYIEYSDIPYYVGELNIEGICSLLPDFEVVEDYGGDVLLKNKYL